jgi:hypothetical protein
VDLQEEIGSLPQVLNRLFEEQRLTRSAFLQLLADGVVIVLAVLDGVIEDCWIRRESRDREFLDVALKRAAGQRTVGDVIESEALADLLKFLDRFHRISPGKCGAAMA